MSSNHLRSWNDTATLQEIVEFVETAARDLPEEERVAVFDNDGTLWCEKPMPIELGFILQRWAAMAEQDASLREKQPWKAAHEKDYEWLGSDRQALRRRRQRREGAARRGSRGLCRPDGGRIRGGSRDFMRAITSEIYAIRPSASSGAPTASIHRRRERRLARLSASPAARAGPRYDCSSCPTTPSGSSATSRARKRRSSSRRRRAGPSSA